MLGNQEQRVHLRLDPRYLAVTLRVGEAQLQHRAMKSNLKYQKDNDKSCSVSDNVADGVWRTG
jgi:hypothetical protein